MTITSPSAHQEGQADMSQPTAARVLLTATQVAQLACVQRSVVSKWRSRFAEGQGAFPKPVGSVNEPTLFDGREVATWLIDTGHGNNPEAVGDLPAFAHTEGIDVNDRAHRVVIEALLAHRAISGTPLVNDEASLDSRAAATDEADRAFRSEIAQRPTGVAWERYVDDLVDGAYSVEGAWHRLHRMAAHRSEGDGATDLSEAAIEVLAGIVLALMPPETIDLALAAGPLADARTVSRVLRAAPEHLDVSVSIPETETETVPAAEARHLTRYLIVHGEEAITEPSLAALFMARLRGTDPQAELDALDDLVLELDEWQQALVLGPAALLVDPLEGAAEATRDALLRSGRVRAIVRLPAGWVPASVRQSLALWVIGGSQREQGIAERISAVGDLRGPALTRAAATDLATDISSVMGSPALARSHAFKHLRVVRTSTLLASEGPLDARGAKPAAPALAGHRRGAVEYAARIDEALAPLTGAEFTATPGSPIAPTTVGELLRLRKLRVLQGARIAREHTSLATSDRAAEGYPVVGTDEVRAGHTGGRRIDRTLLVTAYPRAQLTEPGDVIFLSGSRPAAWVDPVGLSVVAYPARILRIADQAAAQLVPELVAADLAAAQPGRPWRQCVLRRVSGGQAAALSAVLATLQSERLVLEQQAASIARAERLLLDGVAAGVALAKRGTPDATDLNHSPTTEGTH